MIQGIDLLHPNHAGAMLLKDGNTVNYGVIRLKDNMLIYYTGKGLREIWNPTTIPSEKDNSDSLKTILNQKDGEQRLINSGHIAMTPLEQIERIIF